MAQEELDGPCIRQTAIPLEARGVTAAFDTAANRFTIFEELTYDAAGQLLTASLLDYLLPTALDIPTLHLEHMETLSPFTFNGVKGVYLHNQNVVLLLVTLSSFHDTIYSYNRVKPEKSIVVTL